MCCIFHLFSSILFWIQCPTYSCRLCYYVLCKCFESSFLLKLHKISGGLTLATSRYMVTFYLKMLVFICRGGEVDVNLLRKEWGYFLLECTLNDSFSPSFVSDISAVFSVKLNPVRQTLSRGRTEDSCERFTYISSLCCFQAFTCYSFGRFFFSFFFFPS